jgi:hypothetical protein
MIRGTPPPPKAAKHAADAGEEEESEEPGEKDPKKGPHGLVSLDPIVVDLRDAAGETHHLKIGAALELKAELPEEEGKVFVARARDAAITYVRTLTFEEVTDHAKFDAIRTELSTRVLKAFGKAHASKMLISEYVVQ